MKQYHTDDTEILVRVERVGPAVEGGDERDRLRYAWGIFATPEGEPFVTLACNNDLTGGQGRDEEFMLGDLLGFLGSWLDDPHDDGLFPMHLFELLEPYKDELVAEAVRIDEKEDDA